MPLLTRLIHPPPGTLLMRVLWGQGQHSVWQVGRGGLPILQGTKGRFYHKWVRGTLYKLRSLKKIENEKYPKEPVPRSGFLEWNHNAELFAFAKRLGEDFEDSLLRQAFTDKSYVAKERKVQEELNLSFQEIATNERMAVEGGDFLRSMLQIILSYEFPVFPQRGIEAIIHHLTTDAVMSFISTHIGTKDLILCAEYPPSEQTLARAFRAIVSALKRSSGTDRAKKFVEDIVVTHLIDKDINEIWDFPKPWSMLDDIMKQTSQDLEPRLIRESGKNTLESLFVVGLYTTKDKRLFARGFGETVEIAQEMAAREALKTLFGTKDPRLPFKFITSGVHDK